MRALAIGIVCTACAAASAQAPDSTLLRQADAHVKKGACKEAQRLLAPLLEREPPHPKAIVAMARCRIKAGEPASGALRDLEQALARQPGQFDLLAYRGDLYNDLRMLDRADADLTAAVAAAADSAQLILALNRRAWNSLQMRKAGEARHDSERVLALDSLDRGALNNLGLAANQLGDTALAFRALKTMIRRDPMDKVAWLNTGFFLGTCGRHAEALAYYAEAERLGTQDAYFYNNRGFSRLRAGDAKGARKDVERSIKMNGSNPYAYRNLARVELADGDTAAACAAMERALSLGFARMHGDELTQLRRQHCQ